MRRQLETESPGDSTWAQHWPLSFQECWRGDPVPPNISRKHLSGRSDLCALRLPEDTRTKKNFIRRETCGCKMARGSLHP